MSTPAVRLPRLALPVVLVRGLGVATAALLAIDAYVHFHDAALYDIGIGASITEGSLFRAQASVAAVVALALLVRPRWLVWLIALLVAASAAGALYLYTYVDVGRLGPLPDMYEPTWALPGKRLAAGAETAATVTALLGLVVALHARRKTSEPAGDSVRTWSASGQAGQGSK
jgi:hypothetical protein